MALTFSERVQIEIEDYTGMEIPLLDIVHHLEVINDGTVELWHEGQENEAAHQIVMRFYS